MKSEEKTFPLNQSVDTYNPDITDQGLAFSRLKNIQPRLGRYMLPNGLELVQILGDEPIIAFAHYTQPVDKYSSLYAITLTSIYFFDFSTGEFDETPIYTGFPEMDSPVMVVPWYDTVYVSKAQGKLIKLQANVAVEVENAPGARYGLSSNSHLMLAYLSDVTSEQPTTVRWSDLYLPESFEITSDSEADLFELEPSDEEITGLSYQRGVNILYTRNSIWLARYYPLPTGYKFEPLFTGIGNIYHGAQLRIKEVDIFIGEDNFYMIDGLQLTAIGDRIWEFFNSTIDKENSNIVIRAILDTSRNEAYWIYPHVDGGTWSVVYNYKEDKWSDRDPLGVKAVLFLKFPLRGFLVIDDIGDTIDDVADMIDGDWQYFGFNFTDLVGAGIGKIFHKSDSFGRFADSVSDSTFQAVWETYEMFAGKLSETSEINKMTLSFSGAGTPDVQLEVGRRAHRFAAVTWGTAKVLSDSVPGETAFFFRSDGVVKLIRFKLTINNTATDYVSEMTHVSFDHLENEPDDPE